MPSSAGGGNDLLARLFGAKITENWGQQVWSTCAPARPASSASEIVAKAPPDGHTILIVATGYGLNPGLYAKLPYDTLKDFARVNLLAFSPNVLVVHPSLPVKSVKQLIALAKSRPGDLNYASSGAGTGGHLSIELLKHMAGINMVHIPYKGAGDATAAVVSGQVHMLMTAPGAACRSSRPAACARSPWARRSGSRRCPMCRPWPKPRCRVTKLTASTASWRRAKRRPQSSRSCMLNSTAS